MFDFDFVAHPLGLLAAPLQGEPLLRSSGPHVHHYATLLYIEHGVGSHRQGAQTWTASPGDLFFSPAGEVQDAEGLAGVEGWGLAFALGALGAPARDGGTGGLPAPGAPEWPFVFGAADSRERLQVPADERGRWGRRFRELAAEVTARDSGYQHAARALATLTVIEAGRLVRGASPPDGGHRQVIADVFAFIEEHFREAVSLDDAAASLARSPGNLARLVRRYTGRSVNEWIVERRMGEARRLLIESQAGIEEVAWRVGYTDPAHFRRRFRGAHAVSPRAWRAAHR